MGCGNTAKDSTRFCEDPANVNRKFRACQKSLVEELILNFEGKIRKAVEWIHVEDVLLSVVYGLWSQTLRQGLRYRMLAL